MWCRDMLLVLLVDFKVYRIILFQCILIIFNRPSLPPLPLWTHLWVLQAHLGNCLNLLLPTCHPMQGLNRRGPSLLLLLSVPSVCIWTMPSSGHPEPSLTATFLFRLGRMHQIGHRWVSAAIAAASCIQQCTLLTPAPLQWHESSVWNCFDNRLNKHYCWRASFTY